MNFFEKVTGSDMDREYKAFEARAKKLPLEYQAAWQQIKENTFVYADFTGRNLIPVLDGVLGLLEESVCDNQEVKEVLGDDIKGFCAALFNGEGARSYRDKWREELNKTVAKKLADLEEIK